MIKFFKSIVQRYNMLRPLTGLILLFLILFLSCDHPVEKNSLFISSKEQTPIKQSDTNTVYICQSPYAYAYHKYINCEGLTQCNHDIIKVTIKEAIRLKRTKCLKCY
ncbi:MAG: hypothetical protein Q8880_09895 [Bacteroidota bacterium]|nr:hypothetical protein [Bacteroidota bacterium]